MTDIDETATHWHILTVTGDGKVSILKNLDAPTARQAYQRLDPRSHPREYINPEPPSADGSISFTGYGESYLTHTSSIREVHILGPEGVDLQPWKGVAPIVIDLALERQRNAEARARFDVQDAAFKKKPLFG